MKKWWFLFLILGMLAGPWAGQAEDGQVSIEKQIGQWANELGEKDYRFAEFAEANQDYHELGPHPGQWLVTFHSSGVKIGYMVVGVSDTGYSLLEYGFGRSTLFDPATVVPYLTGPAPLSPYYAGLKSVWVSADGIYDAKSGEKYPAAATAEKVDVHSAIQKDSSLTQVIHKTGGQETISWMKPQASIETAEDLIDQLDKGEVFLVGQFFQKNVTAPFQVVGCHRWGQELFIELEDDGSRYVSFSHAAQVGKFVQ